MKKLSMVALSVASLAGMLAVPSQVHAGADGLGNGTNKGDILGIAGSDTTYFVMNALSEAHNVSSRYNPDGDKAVNIPPLVSMNWNVENGEATSSTTSWMKAARLAWPGGAVLPADANCTTQFVFGGVGSTQAGKEFISGDIASTPVNSVVGAPNGGTYDVRLGVQPPNGSGDGQKALTGQTVKGTAYPAGCLDISRSSSAPSSSSGCTSTSVCESWAFALDAIGWTYFPGNNNVSSGLITSQLKNIYTCSNVANNDANADGDLYDFGDTKKGYPIVRYWNQLVSGSDVDLVEPAKIVPYRIQPGSGTGKDVATLMTTGDNSDGQALLNCDGYNNINQDGDAGTSFSFPIVQEHDCRNVSEIDKPNAICWYGYSRWVLQARSLETDKRNQAVFGKFGPEVAQLKRPSFSTINDSETRYKGTRYVYNVLPVSADNGRNPDARRFVGVSLQPDDSATTLAECADGSELAVAGTAPSGQSAVDCNFDGDTLDTGVAVAAVPGFICGDTAARRIIASFGFKPIASGLTATGYGTSNCRRNKAALSNS